MIQRGEQARFALEPRESLFVIGERFRKNFDGDVALELGIPRTIDLTHPSYADGLEDLVVAEFLTR